MASPAPPATTYVVVEIEIEGEGGDGECRCEAFLGINAAIDDVLRQGKRHARGTGGHGYPPRLTRIPPRHTDDKRDGKKCPRQIKRVLGTGDAR